MARVAYWMFVFTDLKTDVDMIKCLWFTIVSCAAHPSLERGKCLCITSFAPQYISEQTPALQYRPASWKKIGSRLERPMNMCIG